MSALVCIKGFNEKTGDYEWAVYEQHYEERQTPEKDGPEELEMCESEGMPKITRYPKLSTALFTEIGKRYHTYLHVWQTGRWTTMALDADENEEQTPNACKSCRVVGNGCRPWYRQCPG